MTKTEQMRADMRNELSCPVDNPFQGSATRMLFVCSAGLLRSPTGAAVANNLGFNARSCGSGLHYALIPISVNLVHWAEFIFFMNEGNLDEALHGFFGDRETCEMIRRKGETLAIEDDFNYGDPNLQRIFRQYLNDTRFVK